MLKSGREWSVAKIPDSCRAAIVVDCYRHSSMRSFYSLYVKSNELAGCLGKS